MKWFENLLTTLGQIFNPVQVEASKSILDLKEDKELVCLDCGKALSLREAFEDRSTGVLVHRCGEHHNIFQMAQDKEDEELQKKADEEIIRDGIVDLNGHGKDKRKSLDAQYRMIEAFLMKRGIGTRGAVVDSYFSEFTPGVGIPGIGGRRESLLMSQLFAASEQEWRGIFPNIDPHPIVSGPEGILNNAEKQVIYLRVGLDEAGHISREPWTTEAVAEELSMTTLGVLKTELLAWAKLLNMANADAEGNTSPEVEAQLSELKEAVYHIKAKDPGLHRIMEAYERARKELMN